MHVLSIQKRLRTLQMTCKISSFVAGIVFLFFGVPRGRRNKKTLRAKLMGLLALLIVLAVLVGMVGCGGNGFSNPNGAQPNTGVGTPVGSYAAVVYYFDSNNNKVPVAVIPVQVR